MANRYPDEEYAGRTLVMEYTIKATFRYPIGTDSGAVSRALQLCTRELCSGVPGIIPESITFGVEER